MEGGGGGRELTEGEREVKLETTGIDHYQQQEPYSVLASFPSCNSFGHRNLQCGMFSSKISSLLCATSCNELCEGVLQDLFCASFCSLNFVHLAAIWFSTCLTLGGGLGEGLCGGGGYVGGRGYVPVTTRYFRSFITFMIFPADKLF